MMEQRHRHDVRQWRGFFASTGLSADKISGDLIRIVDQKDCIDTEGIGEGRWRARKNGLGQHPTTRRLFSGNILLEFNQEGQVNTVDLMRKLASL